jgi:hypothetical protein
MFSSISSEFFYIQATGGGSLNILDHNAIEKPAEITYTEFSSQPEPGCLRQKWIFESFANFPRGHFHTRRLRNCLSVAGCFEQGGTGCAGTREARQKDFGGMSWN